MKFIYTNWTGIILLIYFIISGIKAHEEIRKSSREFLGRK